LLVGREDLGGELRGGWWLGEGLLEVWWDDYGHSKVNTFDYRH
jgi:hypothetical protein